MSELKNLADAQKAGLGTNIPSPSIDRITLMRLHPIMAVVYVSSAGEEVAGDKLGLSNGKLDQIVDDAARFNCNAGVTWVLLFDGERFFQYLEGRRTGFR